MFGGIAPDLDIGGLAETKIKHVMALDAERGQKSCQRAGKLVVNKECHVACNTG
jgi:hypothetical protein